MMAGGSESPSSSSSSSSSFAVFIDTSLDTHLAIVVSPSDTIADLKANLRNHHALCFPDTGDVTVLNVKARRRGSFYHLCDSMLVRSAFNGIKGSWLLHMDVVSTCHQAETTRFEMTYPLLDKPNASCPSKDASTMPGTGHVVSQDGKDVGVKDYANVDKATAEMVSTKKKKSRKRTSAASNDQLVDKDGFLAEKEKHHEKHHGNDDPLKEPSTDFVVKFGSCINNKEIVMSENVSPESITALHDYPTQDCTMDEKKKKKRRKKESTTNHQNSIHSDVRESGNDDPLKEPSTDPVSKSGSCIHNKKVFVSENVRPESITLLHDDPSQKDCTMSEKKKKKRRKKESFTNHQNDIHSDVKKSGNDNPSKEPSSDPVAKSGSYIHHKEVFISENVRSESITSLHDDPSQKDCTVDEKKKKKRSKKESSINHPNEIHFDVPESGPIDTNAVLSIENQDGKKKSQEAFMKDHDNLGEERDAPFLSGQDIRNVIGGDFLEFDSVDPLSLNHEGSNFNGTISKVGLSIHETGSEYTKQGQLTDADLQGILVDKNAYPRNADVVTTLQEAALDEMVSTKKKKTRKRSNTASNDQLVDKSNSLSKKEKHNACDDLSEQPGADLVTDSGSSIQKKDVVILEVLPESTTPLHNGPSPKERTMDEKKKKRKRRKEASTNHQNDIRSVIPDSRPIDSHVLSVENHEATENLQGAAESVCAMVHMEHSTSDLDKINFFELFVPKAAGLEVHTLTQDHSSMETESRKSSEEISKRKRRTNTNSEEFTHNLVNPSSLNELKKKPQDDDPSKLDLVKPLVPLLDKESKTKRGYNKKAVGRASDLEVVHESVDKRVDQKSQISISDTSHKESLSKDDKERNLKDRTSSVSKREPISDDATSESSENEFEICYRKPTSKSVSGKYSASEDFNVGLEETQEGTCLKAHAYMNSSGAPSAAYGENNEDTEANILIQSSICCLW